MNRFVEECRSEWRRLGVPAAVAEDMAAELTADLQEAEAEGVSAEAVLGSSAFDPRAFAAAWAAERGTIARPSRRRRWVRPAALGAFAVAAVVGAVLVVVASPAQRATLAVEGPVAVSPDGRTSVLVITPAGDPVTAPTPVAVPAPPPATGPFLVTSMRDAQTVTAEVDDSRADTRVLGASLLAVGIAGLLFFTALSFWREPVARPAR